MELHPSELGQIDVDMRMTENGIEASLRASQGVTREMLAESLGKLRDLLEQSGLSVADLSLANESGNKSDLEKHASQSGSEHARSSEKNEMPEKSDNKLDLSRVDGLDIFV